MGYDRVYDKALQYRGRHDRTRPGGLGVTEIEIHIQIEKTSIESIRLTMGLKNYKTCSL